MEILINKQRNISDIQEDFSKAFPYLKIEFFNARYTPNQALAKAQMFVSTKSLGECRKNLQEGSMSIQHIETVLAVESDFWNKFGLCVQVFRRSGNVWIETSLTDSWTLERQNSEGREMSSTEITKPDKIDMSDRDAWG